MIRAQDWLKPSDTSLATAQDSTRFTAPNLLKL